MRRIAIIFFECWNLRVQLRAEGAAGILENAPAQVLPAI
jgi:hypothetical protein